jgi:hypothetical protein
MRLSSHVLPMRSYGVSLLLFQESARERRAVNGEMGFKAVIDSLCVFP